MSCSLLNENPFALTILIKYDPNGINIKMEMRYHISTNQKQTKSTKKNSNAALRCTPWAVITHKGENSPPQLLPSSPPLPSRLIFPQNLRVQCQHNCLDDTFKVQSDHQLPHLNAYRVMGLSPSNTSRSAACALSLYTFPSIQLLNNKRIHFF